MKRIFQICFFVFSSIFVILLINNKGMCADVDTIAGLSGVIADLSLENEQNMDKALTAQFGVPEKVASNGEKNYLEGIAVLGFVDTLTKQNDESLANLKEKGWNIAIKQDPGLMSPGTKEPVAGLWDPYTKTIWVNPTEMQRINTNLGRVLTHEIQHAKDSFINLELKRDFSGRLNIKKEDIVRSEMILRQQGRWIPPTEWSAIKADRNYQYQIGTEARIGREVQPKLDYSKSYNIRQDNVLQTIPRDTFKMQNIR